MRCHALSVLVCWVLTIVINHPSGVIADVVQCMACSYTFAGDGTTDFDCVADVYNFSKTSVVICPAGFCWTKVVYTTGYERLTSLFRSCSTSNTVSKKCDPTNTVNPACEVVCSSFKCNDQNGDIWKSMKPGGDNGGVSLSRDIKYCLFLSLSWYIMKLLACL